MTTTIKTSSKSYFNKIQNYLNNKRLFFTPSINHELYTLTIFDLSSSQTTSLIQKMTKHFHLSPKQSEPWVDSVEFRHDSAIQVSLTALTAPSLLAAYTKQQLWQ
jgi:hypothetical protein